MVHATEELEAVAPLINDQIKGYEEDLDIVERPSVGSMAVPVSLGTLIYRFFGCALYSFVQRRGTKVKVRCERTTPSTLTLEVVAEHALAFPAEARVSTLLDGLTRQAVHLGGEITSGGELSRDGKSSSNAFVRLTIKVA